MAPGTHAWDGATLATTITKPDASGGFDGFSREFRSDSEFVYSNFVLDENENRKPVVVLTFTRVTGGQLSADR